MPRPEKVQAVADIKERLESAAAVFIAEYAGLSVKEQQELRRGMRQADAEFKVVKMTLTRRAAAELGLDELADVLTGPTGLAFAAGDAAATAKALRDFASAHDRLVIKGALFAGEFLAPERVTQLADLEPRDVQLAKIAGAMQAPMTAMAGLLAALPRNLATALHQLVEKGGGPEAEEPAEEPAEAPETEPAPEAAAADTDTDTAEAPEAEAEPAPPADAPEAEAEEAPAGAADDEAAEAEEE
jgi:large subunit ribosomal protein L10